MELSSGQQHKQVGLLGWMDGYGAAGVREGVADDVTGTPCRVNKKSGSEKLEMIMAAQISVLGRCVPMNKVKGGRPAEQVLLYHPHRHHTRRVVVDGREATSSAQGEKVEQTNAKDVKVVVGVNALLLLPLLLHY